MEGVVEEKICKVENCTNRVLKKKKVATHQDVDQATQIMKQKAKVDTIATTAMTKECPVLVAPL